MKKVLAIVLTAGVLLTWASTGSGQEKENLYEALWDVREIKVYVADITDSSGAAGDMLGGIKKQLENALVTRMTLNFKIVTGEEDADLIITTDVVERMWADHDPIDTDHLPPSWGALLVDAARDDDYGRIQAIMTVKLGPKRRLVRELNRLRRRKRILWRREVSADITEPEMTEEESKPLLERHLAEKFMAKCFGKNAKMYR